MTPEERPERHARVFTFVDKPLSGSRRRHPCCSKGITPNPVTAVQVPEYNLLLILRTLGGNIHSRCSAPN